MCDHGDNNKSNHDNDNKPVHGDDNNAGNPVAEAQGETLEAGTEQNVPGDVGTDMTPEFTSGEIRAGKALFELQWSFVKGVVGLQHLPEADRPEIAFAGRSNVGKSSLINALVRQNALARTSNTPGRTQELNFFQAEAPLYVVDLPGYGFARAPKEKVDAWTKLVMKYLRGRQTLARVYLLIDARHGIKKVDLQTMDMLNVAAVSYQVVLTKIDKIKTAQCEAVLQATAKILQGQGAAFPLIVETSSEKNIGIAELRATIANVMKQNI